MYIPRIVITSGEPAGVGPDACVALAQRDWEADLVVAADAHLLAATAAALGLPLTVERYDSRRPAKAHRAGTLQVMHIPTGSPVVAGRPDVRNASYVIEMLNRACDGCTNGEFAAMVTAPVQKSVLMDAGYAFSGHTEYLAERTRAAMPVMLLLNDRLRVALVTTHLALADVPRAITKDRLRSTLHIVNMDLERHFSLTPRIAGRKCCHSPASLVTEMKSGAKNTPLTPGNCISALASGELSACSRSRTSKVPASMTGRPGRNFSVAGFGVASV